MGRFDGTIVLPLMASLDPEIEGGKCWHTSLNGSNFPIISCHLVWQVWLDPPLRCDFAQTLRTTTRLMLCELHALYKLTLSIFSSVFAVSAASFSFCEVFLRALGGWEWGEVKQPVAPDIFK